jgi:glycosyltransferase involved in cell wall biosynthesis
VPSSNAVAREIFTKFPPLRRRIHPLSHASHFIAGNGPSLPEEGKRRSAAAGAAERKQRLIDRLDLPEGSFLLGVFDELRSHHGMECVMRAVSAAEQEHIHVVVFNSGPARRIVDGIAASLGLSDRTVFSMEASDSLEEASSCDLFLLSPAYSTVSPWLMGLLSGGAPIIAPDSPVYRELFAENDLLYEPFHVDVLSKRLRWLSTDPKQLERCRELCAKRALNFSFDRSTALARILGFSADAEPLAGDQINA